MSRKISVIIQSAFLLLLLIVFTPATVCAGLTFAAQLPASIQTAADGKAITLTLKIYDEEFGGKMIYSEERKIAAGKRKVSLDIGRTFKPEKEPAKPDSRTEENVIKPENLWLEVVTDGEIMEPRLNLAEIDTTRKLEADSGLTLAEAGLRGAGDPTIVIDGNGITATGSVYSVEGVSSGTFGRGVFGTATGLAGSGVYGFASNFGSTRNYGGYFSAKGTDGCGVYGEAANVGDYKNYGGYFLAKGRDGSGVYGEATNSNADNNYGGFFTATGRTGAGVYGKSSGTQGHGVYGYADNSGDYINDGGHFIAAGGQGRGVYGYASNITSTNYGGYFKARGATGCGVYGESTGWNGKGVYGIASYSGTNIGYLHFGGYFEAKGTKGTGVYGQALGTDGRGVVGNGADYDFYAGGSGTNYGAFTGAHDVRLEIKAGEEIKPGMLVSLTGVSARAPAVKDGRQPLSSTLPTVTLTRKAQDKAVLGVLVKESSLPKEHWYKAGDEERFGIVNALGEGCMWVCDANGDIEAGDNLISSTVPGYGQRQDDAGIYNYTIGKATQTINWDKIDQTITIDGRKVKVYLLTVIYTSG